MLLLTQTQVAPEWVDYNGHMNDAAYALAFSRAGDAWMERIALGPQARQDTGLTLYTLQIMLHYFQEAKLGDPLVIVCQLLEHDTKRARLWMEMRAPGQDSALAATEQLYLCVQQSPSPRAAPWRAETMAALTDMARDHSALPMPALAGRGIALKR